MLELIKYIAESLVDDPSQVVVQENQEGDLTVIELSVAPDDMGKIIGKQGRIAKAIRTVLKAASVKEDKKYSLEII